MNRGDFKNVFGFVKGLGGFFGFLTHPLFGLTPFAPSLSSKKRGDMIWFFWFFDSPPSPPLSRFAGKRGDMIWFFW